MDPIQEKRFSDENSSNDSGSCRGEKSGKCLDRMEILDVNMSIKFGLRQMIIKDMKGIKTEGPAYKSKELLV